ncbi:similar to An03g05650 [Aspergillus luchuensis]|nr:similar to An03g05650 [Aspergillus luchuensis]
MSEDQDSDSTTTEYQFVFGTDQPGARSHAMRQFWRRRHQALQSSPQTTRPQLRTLLPKDYSSESRGYQQDASQGQTPDPPEGEGREGSAYAKSPASDVDHGHQSSIIQGPGPKFPIDLSAKDQEIFSSCELNTENSDTLQATDVEIYTGLDLHASFGPGLSQSTGFDPVRDVWLPLDLSNSASFCALMAHAAAHVAHRQGQTKSIESEKFRTLAVGIIAKWLADERKSTQDDTITAIARLLMFEKYWAIDDQWRAHKNGLVSVINARGGVENFRSSWRLHMVLFLAFSLAEPSRNSSPAHVWEISEYFTPATVHPAIELRLHQVNPQASQGLIAYPDIHETITFLASFSNLSGNASPNVQDHTLLCLFVLAVIFQESLYSSSPEFGRSFTDKLPVLNEALSKSKSIWKRSSQELYEFLMEDHFNLLLSPSARSFITKVAQNLVYLNESAQAAVAKCLLNKLLWQSQEVKADSHLQSDGTR